VTAAAGVAGLALIVGVTAKGVVRSLSCHKNLVQLQLSIGMYCADSDGRHPLERAWCDVAEPYSGTPMLYRCPGLPDAACGYTFNAALVGHDTALLKHRETIPLVYDGPGGWNACGGMDAFTARHRGYANLAFADGHVTYVAPKDLPTLTWNP
jgi:prepilin-type processing-associated H-X9-DG protein